MNSNVDMMASSMAYRAGQMPSMAPAGADYAAMQKTAQEFESFYLGQMLQPMFANIEPAEPFNGGSGAKIWQQMQVDEFGKAISKSGGVGIADMVLRQMIAMQEQGAAQ